MEGDRLYGLKRDVVVKKYNSRRRSANEEMCALYGAMPDKTCRLCDYRVESFCSLTNGKLKCNRYGLACGKYVSSQKYML